MSKVFIKPPVGPVHGFDALQRIAALNVGRHQPEIETWCQKLAVRDGDHVDFVRIKLPHTRSYRRAKKAVWRFYNELNYAAIGKRWRKNPFARGLFVVERADGMFHAHLVLISPRRVPQSVVDRIAENLGADIWREDAEDLRAVVGYLVAKQIGVYFLTDAE